MLLVVSQYASNTSRCSISSLSRLIRLFRPAIFGVAD
jgi:hypothetical protein